MMGQSTAERTATHRSRRKARGYTILHCQLPADVSKILVEAMKKYPQKTKAEIIADCLYVYQEEGMSGPDFSGF